MIGTVFRVPLPVDVKSFALPTSVDEVHGLLDVVRGVEDSMQTKAQVHVVCVCGNIGMYAYEGWAIPVPKLRRSAKTPGIFVARLNSQTTLWVSFLNLRTGRTRWTPPYESPKSEGEELIWPFPDGSTLYNTAKDNWKPLIPLARQSALKLVKAPR